MANFSNCLNIVNRMPQQDQDALLARLDELQAQGLSPKEAQLQAAIDVLAQVKGEAARSGKQDILQSVERPEFYSQLQRSIEQVPQRLATMAAPAWKQWLTANAPKLGIKADEIEWSGINDYLDLQGKAKLSKDDLVAYLDDSGVKVGEVTLGAPQLTADGLPVGYDIIDEGDGRWSFSSPSMASKLFKSRDAAVEAAKNDAEMELENGEMSVSQPKYGQYALPGGENYREVLITLPSKDLPFTPAVRPRVVDMGRDENGRARFDVVRDGEVLDTFSSWSKAQDLALKIEEDENIETNRKRAAASPQYKSSHWDEANILAHIRVNDRTDADGKRVLFVEEVQSDWGQEGKKKGFKREVDREAIESRMQAITARLREIAKNPVGETEELAAEWNRLSDEKSQLTDKLVSSGHGVPVAPFVTKTEGWLNLALKRIAMMAVEGGYDKVAFVNGEQSADRYDLSRQVSSIRTKWSDSARGERKVDIVTNQPMNVIGLIVDKSGTVIGSMTNGMNGKTLDEVIGKEMAQKVMETDGEGKWSGLDLKVGGEGMKTFYDQIVPQALNKLLPKLGGEKLGTVRIGKQGDEWGVFDATDEENEGIYSRHATRAEADKAAAEYDGGVEVRRVTDATEQPGFDVTDKMRETVGQGVALFSPDRPWFDDLSSLKVTTNYQLGDLLKTSKKLSWWNRTIGTQYDLAQKHPQFKRVFDAVQRFINDVSAYATRAADLAPTILPKLESWKDIARSPLSAEDVKALREPIFGGTLKYTRDEDGNIVETEDVSTAGVVFKDEELRSMFGLDDRQIGLYREFRRATNKSLSDLAVSDMLRYLGTDGEGVRVRALNADNLDSALNAMVAHLDQLIEQQPQRAEVLEDTKRAIKEKAGQAIGLMARGYAPLSRFGQYTVYAVGPDGEQLYFSMFENERDANKMAREMREQYPEATVTTGTMSQESYKLFSGVTPETLALFGESLGLEESGVDPKSEVFQQYLKMAKTNRSAMKRLIQRKGIDGFSEDAGRVLAGFVYSNARQISTNLHAGEIGRSAQAVTDGDVKDAAIRLMEYVQNPREEAQAIRGLLFTQFIGGSIASAMVNMTQPFTMTLPYLAQFDGATGAAARMADAVKLTSRGIRNDDELKAALKRAEDEGVVSPQEVHQLMAQAQGKGKLQTGDGTRMGDAAAKVNNAMAKLELAWGKVFSAAEQFNRRVTFIAAYKLARDQGMADPMAFAQKAIAETQGVYNKGNKPTWARGAVGGTLFTFKQYSIGYIEFLRRMWGNGPEGKKAVGLALGVLFLSAGLGGMPGADDLDDVIDGFMQRVLGLSFDSKQKKKEFFASILGQSGAEFVMSGLSGLPGVPIDVSGRMSLGNLIPGTGLLTKKRDYSRDYLEVVGPAGTLFTNMGTAVANVASGEFTKAAESVAPQAAQNWIKAIDMATMGYYRDLKGRKVVDTDEWDAMAKFIGFQPRAVAQVQEATSTQQNLITQNKLRETEIADKWARGRIERKPDLIEEAKQELADWNRSNPESPIRIDPTQINKRVQEANKTKAQRIAGTAPSEIRGAVKRELEKVD